MRTLNPHTSFKLKFLFKQEFQNKHNPLEIFSTSAGWKMKGLHFPSLHLCRYSDLWCPIHSSFNRQEAFYLASFSIWLYYYSWASDQTESLRRHQWPQRTHWSVHIYLQIRSSAKMFRNTGFGISTHELLETSYVAENNQNNIKIYQILFHTFENTQKKKQCLE